MDANKADRVACVALRLPDVGHTTFGGPVLRMPLVPELTIVTLGGGVEPLANPVDKTFWVLCIMNDLAAPALPKVSTFFSITDEPQPLSIKSLPLMLSKSFPLAETIVFIFGDVVCKAGLTAVTLNDTPDDTAFIFVRFIIFRETIALCKMLPVGKDFDDTLTYCAGVPIIVPLDVLVPKPITVVPPPCDITVLIVPPFELIGNL